MWRPKLTKGVTIDEFRKDADATFKALNELISIALDHADRSAQELAALVICDLPARLHELGRPLDILQVESRIEQLKSANNPKVATIAQQGHGRIAPSMEDGAPPSAPTPEVERDTVTEGETTVEQSLRRLDKINEAVTEKVRQLLHRLQSELEELEGEMFPATDEGYALSFKIIESIQKRILQSGFAFSKNDRCVYLCREMPPNSIGNNIAFLLVDMLNGTPISKPFPSLPSLRITRLDSPLLCFGEFAIARLNLIEHLRVQLLELMDADVLKHLASDASRAKLGEMLTDKAKRDETIDLAGKALVSDFSRKRDLVNVKFGYAGPKTNDRLVPVTMYFENGSFKVRASARGQKKLYSGSKFPKILLIDNPATSP